MQANGGEPRQTLSWSGFSKKSWGDEDSLASGSLLLTNWLSESGHYVDSVARLSSNTGHYVIC